MTSHPLQHQWLSDLRKDQRAGSNTVPEATEVKVGLGDMAKYFMVIFFHMKQYYPNITKAIISLLKCSCASTLYLKMTIHCYIFTHYYHRIVRVIVIMNYSILHKLLI